MSFHVPIKMLYKNDFFIVIVLSILFFFRPNSPDKKADSECCLIENPRSFFNLDCKTVFNNICPFHKFCVGTLLIQYLNACKSLILLFYPKLFYQTINFFVFRFKSAYNCKDGKFFYFCKLMKELLSSGSSTWDLTLLIK